MYWWGWWSTLYFIVPVVAIVGWFVYKTQSSKYRAQERSAELSGNFDLRTVIAQNTEASRQLLAKLENMDQRLAAVEKTLNDIP